MPARPNFSRAFQALFGTDPQNIKSVCLLVPFASSGLFKAFRVKNYTKGAIYSSGQSDFFTFIHTRMGSPFAGDAVLHLKDTPCRYVILFGACGALQKHFFSEKELFLIDKAHAQDSFIGMLEKKPPFEVFFSDRSLFQGLLDLKNEFPIKTANCLTVGSLRLEKNFLNNTGGFGCDIADMESAAVFAAAKSAHLKAASLLFATDCVTSFPLEEALSKRNLGKMIQKTQKFSLMAYEILKLFFLKR